MQNTNQHKYKGNADHISQKHVQQFVLNADIIKPYSADIQYRKGNGGKQQFDHVPLLQPCCELVCKLAVGQAEHKGNVW